MTKDFTIIKCPKCGREYVAAEIFMPSDLLGKPNNIIRDDDGKIILCEGEQPELKEEYTCDNCGTTFEAFLHIESYSRYNKTEDDDEFVISLRDEDKEELF